MVISLAYGLNVSSKKYDGKNKYIRITDIDDDTHKLIKNNLTSPNAPISESSNYLLEDGDILFARTGASVGKTYKYNISDGDVYYAGFLIRARTKTNYDTEFLFQNTLTNNYNRFVKITSQRSGQPGINAKEYSNFCILVPSFQEQGKIGSILQTLDSLIASNQLQQKRRFLDLRNVFLSYLYKTS